MTSTVCMDAHACPPLKITAHQKLAIPYRVQFYLFHNLVTTMSQPCDKVGTVSKEVQDCNMVATIL